MDYIDEEVHSPASVSKNNKKGLIIFFIVVMVVVFLIPRLTQKHTNAWVLASSAKVVPEQLEIINVTSMEMMHYSALANALEDADKHGHSTNTFLMNSTVADELLQLFRDKTDSVIDPYMREKNFIRYHLYIRIEETQKMYSISISYQEEKPGIA